MDAVSIIEASFISIYFLGVATNIVLITQYTPVRSFRFEHWFVILSGPLLTVMAYSFLGFSSARFKSQWRRHV